MESQQQKKILEKIIRDFLEKMGFSNFKIQIAVPLTSEREESQILISADSEDSKYLIGKGGANLVAIQHLLRIIFKKQSSERLSFSLDVNEYREKQHQNLVRLAESAAQRVLGEKKPFIMEPMSAYERRIIHATISEIDGVKTESIGEGEDRKVVIKPISLEEELELKLKLPNLFYLKNGLHLLHRTFLKELLLMLLFPLFQKSLEPFSLLLGWVFPPVI